MMKQITAKTTTYLFVMLRFQSRDFHGAYVKLRRADRVRQEVRHGIGVASLLGFQNKTPWADS